MSATKDQANKQVQESVERIRALNEQVLEAGRVWGQGFLDAYEQSIGAFADFQVSAAERTDVEWISEIAKAQADFTRTVTKRATEAARQFLK